MAGVRGEVRWGGVGWDGMVMCGGKLLWWDLEFIYFDFLDFGGKKNWGWDGIKGIDRKGYGNDIDGLRK